MFAFSPSHSVHAQGYLDQGAQAAKDWLVNEGKVSAERVFIVVPKLTAEGIKDKGKATRADFALK